SATNSGATFAHLGLYAALALLLCWALASGAGRQGLASGWPIAAMAFALAVLYGAADEVHQAFVPGRTASEADLLLDAVGALLGVWLAWSVATIVLKTRGARP
ncbi:MAG: VanZ family protein, partial [Dehalococcoidia bacterium]|nr:VanZ family protein [Dehalococcoidia bacterium]